MRVPSRTQKLWHVVASVTGSLTRIAGLLVLASVAGAFVCQATVCAGVVFEEKARSTTLSALPPAAQASISSALGRNIDGYKVRTNAIGFHAVNAQHHLVTDFTSRGVEVRSGDVRWRLFLRGYGRGDPIKGVSVIAPQARLNRVEYRRGVLTEWYVNGPAGLEQGFTFSQPPGKSPSAPLTIALTLAGDLKASIDPGNKSLTLTRPDGQAALRYAGLAAYDRTGRELRTWLVLRAKRLLLRVDDAGARYPLMVDPFVQQAKLTPSNGTAANRFGLSVSISGDTVVVGAPSASPSSAYVFVKPASGWATMTQTAQLFASGAPSSLFGTSVAISGNTVVVGAPRAYVDMQPRRGATYVFIKPASGWATTSRWKARLTASDGTTDDQFGTSVAISGNTIVAGAPATNSNNPKPGRAYVFVKPTSGWSTMNETAKLTTSDGTTDDNFGASIAISGNTVAAGTPFAKVGSNSAQGAAYLFVEPTSGWTAMTQTAKLTASDGAANDFFGRSLSISGTTVVAGAPNATVGSNVGQGAVYVFVKPASGWGTTSTFNAKLTTSDGAANDSFGNSVNLSSSGSTLVAGASGATVGSNVGQGAAYVFVKPASGWGTTSTFDAKLTASDGGANDFFGTSVGVSGGAVVTGAPHNISGPNPYQGAAYIFGMLP